MNPRAALARALAHMGPAGATAGAKFTAARALGWTAPRLAEGPLAPTVADLVASVDGVRPQLGFACGGAA